jgi:hypothetical protein
MSDYERGEFLAWLEEQKGKTFNDKAELLADCMDDVNVLRQVCCAFRNLFLKLVNMDPISTSNNNFIHLQSSVQNHVPES